MRVFMTDWKGVSYSFEAKTFITTFRTEVQPWLADLPAMRGPLISPPRRDITWWMEGVFEDPVNLSVRNQAEGV